MPDPISGPVGLRAAGRLQRRQVVAPGGRLVIEPHKADLVVRAEERHVEVAREDRVIDLALRRVPRRVLHAAGSIDHERRRRANRRDDPGKGSYITITTICHRNNSPPGVTNTTQNVFAVQKQRL